ncbi:MAG: HDOD domain-containing protein [Gallionellaceae bacterium]|nr:HDOD domain-containing protein [Gallionellaceae bacterium]
MQFGHSINITGQALAGIIIPPCPSSLTNIMSESKRSSINLESLSRLIGREAGIVGPLLKLANSPLYGLACKVTSISHALNVLGIQSTINLIHNIALRQSIDGKSHHFEKFWERSSLAAAIAERISVKFNNISKDDAYIAALFHDCGIPMLMMKFKNYRETVMAECKQGKTICEVENEFFSTSHAVVGGILTRAWMLSEHICKAILYHHDPNILASPQGKERNKVCDLIALLHIAEGIADEHLFVRDAEWPQYERDVLKYFDLSTQEFNELKGDTLAFLNGE